MSDRAFAPRVPFRRWLDRHLEISRPFGLRPMPDPVPNLTVRPIGVVRSPFLDRMSAPRQPRAAEGVRGTIELFPGHGYERALHDLAGWEYLWVIFWFHYNRGWRPMVLPPRSTRRRGLFSTRTPHRPNPIGLSAVRLESVDGLTLHIADVDILDGTPVLDLKPYVAWADALPDARAGWLEEDPHPTCDVHFDPLAMEQLTFLREISAIDLETPLRQNLGLGPQPHPYRRISRDADGLRVAVREWRARFEVVAQQITVTRIWSGYRLDALANDDPVLDVHRVFEARWGRPPTP